jgi:hypothetical protein
MLAIPGIFKTVSGEITSPGGGVGEIVGDGSGVSVGTVVGEGGGAGEASTLDRAWQESVHSARTVMAKKILLVDIFPPCYCAGRCI